MESDPNNEVPKPTIGNILQNSILKALHSSRSMRSQDNDGNPEETKKLKFLECPQKQVKICSMISEALQK